MALITWKDRDRNDPWTAFKSLQDEINSLFDSDLYPASNGLFDRSASPPMDVVEGEDSFYLTCELPGVDQEDLEVSVASHVLTLKGEKKDSAEKDQKGKCYRQEIWHGSFQKTFSLPESIDVSRIDAQMEDGILTLTLPKREEVKPRLIRVNSK